MQLQKTPFPIDFLRNNPEFVIRTSPYERTERKLYRVFHITALTAGTFTVQTASATLQWPVTSWAGNNDMAHLRVSASPEYALIQLQRKVLNDQRLCTDYRFAAAIESDHITLEVEALAGTDGDTFSISSTTVSDVTEQTANAREGQSAKPRDDYRILARFESGQLRTPELVFDDNNGFVTIPTRMLSAWLGQPDIPRLGETLGAKTCSNQLLPVRLLYAEAYDGMEGNYQQSGEILMLNAEVQRYHRDDNRGDWTSADTKMLWKKTDIDIYGQDNNATVRTDTATEQYLYILNPTASAITKTATVTVTATGGTVTTTASLTFPARSVCRVACGWNAFISVIVGDPLRYSISIPVTGGSITRTFLLRPRPYNAFTMLLLNRCRLYESMTFVELAREVKTEGEKTLTADGERYQVTSTTETLTLRTGRRTATEIALLKDAISVGDHLLVDGNHAWRATIAPDTLKYIDTGEDLQEAEVKVVLSTMIDRTSAITADVSDQALATLDTRFTNQQQ